MLRCYVLSGVLAGLLVLASGPSFGAGRTCGDSGLSCETGERCCERKVATFCEDGACSSVRAEGQCIPEDRSCNEFWCGNRQCQTGWLLSRDVCCIYYQAGNAPEYSCSSSELSCPGNNTRLTIRPTAVASYDPAGI